MTASELLAEMHPGRTILDASRHECQCTRQGAAHSRHARYLCTTARFWLNLQSAYELRVAERWKGSAIRKSANHRKAA